MDNICGDTIHFSHDVTSCSRKVAAYWSAGRARFDKRMRAAAGQDEARRLETMAEPGPGWPARGKTAWVRLLTAFRSEPRAVGQAGCKFP